jgi:hypothetical protein
MSILLKLEELLLAVLSVWLFSRAGLAWWWFPALFLAPDLSIVGYAAGPRIGAAAYNLVHHKAVAVIVFLLGTWLPSPGFQAAGAILLGHSSLDRVLGFGLKYPDSFGHTHLGLIGRAARQRG